MLLLRWLFPQDIPWAFYDLEDDPQEQYDEDWLSFYDPEYFVDVLYPDEDVKEEFDDDLQVFYWEDDYIYPIYPDEDIREEYEDDIWDARGLVDLPDFIESQLFFYPEEDLKEEFEDDTWDGYGQVDTPVAPSDVSEQIWIVVLDDDPREEYDDEVWDAFGQEPPPLPICPLFPDNVDAAVYYVTENGSSFYIARDCAFYIAALLATLGGKQPDGCYEEPEEIEIDSSNIESISYDNKTQQLKVKFKSGATYKYHNAPKSSVKSIQKAKSAGKYLHKNIKGKYRGFRQ